MGITCHVASILGSFGHQSPTYFPSPADVELGNDEMLAIQTREGDRVRCYVVVNPNYTDHALAEIDRCVSRGAVGIKLAASRRADDPLLDPIAEAAAALGLPILHHIWQHRRRDWPNQEASDGVELGRLAARHPKVQFILAHIGGGGDYLHTNPAVRELPNVLLDISGSGVDRGMLDRALEAVGPERMLFGTDLTMETGLAKLRALEVIGLDADAMRAIRWKNAMRIFPPGTFSQAPARGSVAAAPERSVRR
jgi:predicted TIM-barrel fold metal-dependent hydrolase